jgi:hypothetical protein
MPVSLLQKAVEKRELYLPAARLLNEAGGRERNAEKKETILI